MMAVIWEPQQQKWTLYRELKAAVEALAQKKALTTLRVTLAVMLHDNDDVNSGLYALK